MMKSKRRILLIIAVMMVLATGCQLAKPELGTVNKDALVGAFVTQEAIGAEKIYGEIVETDEGGMTITFPELEGYSCGSIYRPEEEHWMRVALGDDEFSEFKSSNDDNNNRSLEVTMYVSKLMDEANFYVNPVYMEKSGKIYVLGGTMGDAFSKPIETSVNHTETYEKNDGKEVEKEAMSLTVNFKWKMPAEKVVLVQMDENHKEVTREEYLIDELPKELIPEKEAAYIIVEEYVTGEVIRKINEPANPNLEFTDGSTDSSIDIFKDNGNGVCCINIIYVLWDKR